MDKSMVFVNSADDISSANLTETSTSTTHFIITCDYGGSS